MQKYLRESNHLSNICNPTGKIIRPEMKESLLSSCHGGPRDVIGRGNSYLFYALIILTAVILRTRGCFGLLVLMHESIM